MKTLRMMFLLFAVAFTSIGKAQDVQFVKQDFFTDKNLVFSGMSLGLDGMINVCTSKESYPDDQNGVAIRKLMLNGDQKSKVDLKLDIVQNFTQTPDGGYLVLFNYDMFEDAEAVRSAYSNIPEYYMSDREYGNMPGLLKINEYGSYNWVVELKYAEYFHDDDESSIITLPDNHYWVIFNYSAEDTTSEYGGQDDFTRAVLVNGYGTVVVEKDFLAKEYGLLRAPVLLDDGRVMLFSDQKFSGGSRGLAWLDRQGNLVTSEAIEGLDGLYSHEAFSAGNHGYIITGRQDEKNYMALVDSNGNVSWKIPTSGVIHAMNADGNGIFILTTEKYIYSYPDGSPVQYSVTRYSYDGTASPYLSMTTAEPVDFRRMITTGYGLVLAGNVKRGNEKGVSVYVTVPAEQADIFRNMNTYDYREYAKAVVNGDLDRIRALAAFGIDPDYKPGSKGDREAEVDNPLLMAFKIYNYDIAEELLKTGAEPDAMDIIPVRYFIYEKPEIYNMPVTPLMYIALNPGFYDAPRYVELLNRYQADFKRISRNGTAFRQAFQMQHTDFMDLYIKYQAFSADELNNMFQIAFENDLPESLQWILDHGANPYAMDFLGDIYMDKGMQSESKEIKAVLKEYAKTHKK